MRVVRGLIVAGVNRVIILGNLGKDPEVRRTKDGKSVATFSVATTESWKDKTTGEKVGKTEWHNIVIFNSNLATVSEKHLRKGDMVYLEGRLQTRKWEDNDGVSKYSTEIVLGQFDGRLEMIGGKSKGQRLPAEPVLPKRPATFAAKFLDNEDIPF